MTTVLRYKEQESGHLVMKDPLPNHNGAEPVVGQTSGNHNLNPMMKNRGVNAVRIRQGIMSGNDFPKWKPRNGVDSGLPLGVGYPLQKSSARLKRSGPQGGGPVVWKEHPLGRSCLDYRTPGIITSSRNFIR